ncbi:MAG: class I SAM-dependent methyltransferase [Acidimicrobiales bacterium]
MSNSEPLIDHYTQNGLLASIEAGLTAMGKTPETVTVDDLAPVDEFHVGGRPATKHLLDQLDLTSSDHVIDVGCGLGGPSRFAADQVARVTGIDLTPEYTQVGNTLNGWVGLSDSVELHAGSALEMPFDAGTFDAGYMIHVGMNISDKRRLMRELARVLKPGALFGIYDIMRFTDAGPEYPVPWSSEAATSHVAHPEIYQETAAEAGLIPVSENNRHRQAVEFFDRQAQAAAASQDGAAESAPPAPPPLGLHLVMGSTVGSKIKNMAAAIRSEQIAPVEMLFRRIG